MRTLSLLLLLSFLLICLSSEAQSTTYFLRSGDTLRPQSVTTRLPLSKHPYFIFDQEETILFEDIAYFETSGETYAILGIGKNSQLQLLRKVKDYGRIDLYEQDIQTAESYPARQKYRTKRSYFLKDKGGLQKLNYKSVRAAVEDHPESLAALQPAKNWRTTEQIVMGVGVGFAMYTMAQSVNKFSRTRQVNRRFPASRSNNFSSNRNVQPAGNLLFLPLFMIIPLGTKSVKEASYYKAFELYK